MKKTLLAIVAIGFLATGPVIAQTMGSGGMGSGMMGGGYGMTPCTTGGGYNMMGHSGMMPMMGGFGMMHAQGFDDMQKHETFAKETREMRKELHNLMFDYGEARWNPDTTVGDLNKMAEEMNQLRQNIQQKMPQ